MPAGDSLAGSVMTRRETRYSDAFHALLKNVQFGENSDKIFL